MAAEPDDYALSVFINCPFSSEYQSMFRAILFTIYDCGCRPRCALEVADSSESRLSKIGNIIRQSKLGIHDISFMKLDRNTRLPRFNMPFELGMFLAAKVFGSGHQKNKIALVLDENQYRYRAALSDISGQDIAFHKRVPRRAIQEVRDWLNSCEGNRRLPGGDYINKRYSRFSRQLPAASKAIKLNAKKLTYADMCRAIEAWLKDNV